MKMLIDIPDEWKIRIEYNRRPNTIECGELVESIWKGKMLPKWYGKLIDADALVRKAYEESQGMTNNNFGVEVEWLVDKSSAILEADGRCEE